MKTSIGKGLNILNWFRRIDVSMLSEIRLRKMTIRGLVMGIWLIIFYGLSITCAATPGPWLKVADSGRLALWVETGFGICKVVDYQGNTTWDSRPVFKEKPDDYWVIAYQSAFIIRYVTDYGSIENAYTGAANCERRFSALAGNKGCSYRFNFTDLKVGFTVEYSLGAANNLRVNIPLKSLSDPKSRLLDIRFLPFFGGLPFKSNGYVVLPDGCGGIITPDHLTAVYKSDRVYGERFHWNAQPVGNHGFIRSLSLSDYRNHQNCFYNLPMFGIVRTGSGVLGVISRGQFQAELGTQVTPQIFLLAVSPRLIIREATYDMYGRLHASPIFYRGDRTVDYYWLTNQDASYVGIARKYRKIMLAAQYRASKAKLRFKSRYRDTGYRLRLFMGVAEQYQDTEKLLVLTSFTQAENILKDLHQKGARDLQVILVGWTRRGFLGDNPRHFPPDSRFGGLAGLKRLLATGKKLGYSIGLEFDNSYTFKNSHGFNRDDTVKDIQEIPIDIGYGSKEYLLCQPVAWSKFIKNDRPKLAKLNCNGYLIFNGFNQGLITCYDTHHRVDGNKLARILPDSIREISKTQKVGLTVAEDFLTGAVSAIYDLPAGCSENCDRAIPLTPLIFHGIIPYSFDPINLRRDGRREFLRMVEYGGIPGAFLTAKTVAELIYAKYNPLYSGKYTDWRSAVLREYKIYQKDLRGLQARTIVDHRRIAADVYLTVYDDHSKVLVNYSPKSLVFDKIKVGPEQYVIICKER
jgi:hypothetical protein